MFGSAEESESLLSVARSVAPATEPWCCSASARDAHCGPKAAARSTVVRQVTASTVLVLAVTLGWIVLTGGTWRGVPVAGVDALDAEKGALGTLSARNEYMTRRSGAALGSDCESWSF